MRFRRVCLEAFGYTLPEEILTTAQLERRLAPVYERLRLPEGRLELMTGIRQRRFFPKGTKPSTVSIRTADRAIQASRIERRHFGALVHGSVCRDFLEPATACRVHQGLELPNECATYDVSNACLGLLNGVLQVASMIELGQICAGVVVGTECGRELVENTIAMLNADTTITRESIKDYIASLTIGSASVAMVLCDEVLSRTGNRIPAAVVHSDTTHHQLCHSRGMETLMQTDSEELLQRGVATGAATFARFLGTANWNTQDVDKTFCHQVGVAHRRLLFETLGLDPAIDFTTFAYLGNTGAAALPVTMALGIENGHLQKGDRVALMGIGSGINCLMVAVDWQRAAQEIAPRRSESLPANAEADSAAAMKR